MLMREKSFLCSEHPTVTVMVQAESPERIKELVLRAEALGGEAYGMQMCRLRPEYRNRETYRELFSLAPVYVTNYRLIYNENKSDDTLAEELIELAECGASLVDVMGDIFDKQPGELTRDPDAIKKQIALIDRLHECGSEVLMSSHLWEYASAERVLNIALEHQSRGADISKVVAHANTVEEEIECLRIISLLKRTLKIPFLFLVNGECHILRRIGGELGNCMYLCVVEHDEYATPTQPLLSDVKLICDTLRK